MVKHYAKWKKGARFVHIRIDADKFVRFKNIASLKNRTMQSLLNEFIDKLVS